MMLYCSGAQHYSQSSKGNQYSDASDQKQPCFGQTLNIPEAIFKLNLLVGFTPVTTSYYVHRFNATLAYVSDSTVCTTVTVNV